MKLAATAGAPAADSVDEKLDTIETVTAKDSTVALDATVSKEATAAKAAACTETRLAELDAGNMPGDIDTIINTGSDGPWTTGSGGDATEAKQDLIIQMQEADETFVPAAGTLTKYIKGTATEILKKNLKDPAGAAVDSTEDIIAATEDVTI